jgi:hypothetical protein
MQYPLNDDEVRRLLGRLTKHDPQPDRTEATRKAARLLLLDLIRWLARNPERFDREDVQTINGAMTLAHRPWRLVRAEAAGTAGEPQQSIPVSPGDRRPAVPTNLNISELRS